MDSIWAALEDMQANIEVQNLEIKRNEKFVEQTCSLFTQGYSETRHQIFGNVKEFQSKVEKQMNEISANDRSLLMQCLQGIKANFEQREQETKAEIAQLKEQVGGGVVHPALEKIRGIVLQLAAQLQILEGREAPLREEIALLKAQVEELRARPMGPPVDPGAEVAIKKIWAK